jgi:hypothetical protein
MISVLKGKKQIRGVTSGRPRQYKEKSGSKAAAVQKENAPTGVGAHFSTRTIVPEQLSPCQVKSGIL